MAIDTTDGEIEQDLRSGGNALVTVDLPKDSGALIRGRKHVRVSANATKAMTFGLARPRRPSSGSRRWRPSTCSARRCSSEAPRGSPRAT